MNLILRKSNRNEEFFARVEEQIICVLVNSMEVEKVFHRYGFEVVFTEDMSCLEQIKLFRSANM